MEISERSVCVLDSECSVCVMRVERETADAQLDMVLLRRRGLVLFELW